MTMVVAARLSQLNAHLSDFYDPVRLAQGIWTTNGVGPREGMCCQS
jgi:hypothetical protein